MYSPSSSTMITSGVAALGLTALHLLCAKMRFLDGLPRSRWLSLSAGASVAYVFVHLLPELSYHQAHLVEAIRSWGLPELPEPLYMLTLMGFAMFYGLERVARRERDVPQSTSSDDEETPREVSDADVFWLHVGSFAVYNMIIGYLLVDSAQRADVGLWLFALAMGLHFIVNDWGLRETYQELYQRWGRWILSASILLGWIVSLFFEVPQYIFSVLFAMLAGSVILNVMKEELPEERKSRFGAFAIGALSYAILLLVHHSLVG